MAWFSCPVLWLAEIQPAGRSISQPLPVPPLPPDYEALARTAEQLRADWTLIAFGLLLAAPAVIWWTARGHRRWTHPLALLAAGLVLAGGLSMLEQDWQGGYSPTPFICVWLAGVGMAVLQAAGYHWSRAPLMATALGLVAGAALTTVVVTAAQGIGTGPAPVLASCLLLAGSGLLLGSAFTWTRPNRWLTGNFAAIGVALLAIAFGALIVAVQHASRIVVGPFA